MSGIAVDALLFDVFGTLVDWRSSLIADLTAFGAEYHFEHVDWTMLVNDWRGAYVPSMDAVRRGDRPWTNIDALHAASLDVLLARGGIELPAEARAWIVRRWHHLRPWPDTVPGMTRLRQRFILGSLSNGNVALLVDLARSAQLPFDVIFSAEHFRHYKPDAAVYRGACDLLMLPPQRVMLVAAHNGDLAQAAAQGMRTAFVARPSEYGPRQRGDRNAGEGIDIAVASLEELAERLGV